MENRNSILKSLGANRMSQNIEPNVFQRVIKPLLPLLEKEAAALGNDPYKLSFCAFTLNLCYAVMSSIASIRQLVTDIKTNPDAQEAGLIVASSSMYSEAFDRYAPHHFRALFTQLLKQLEFKRIPGLDKLGQFMVIDGSIFPAISTMDWATYKETSNGFKLHLALGLNQLIPTEFLLTDANGSEKQVLKSILTAGFTYIADRGYVSFKLFDHITSQSAHFIIRVKENMKTTVLSACQSIELPDTWKEIHQVTDEHVIFNGDKQERVYRLISFEVWGEYYRICSDRFDLKTYEIIMLYAYRWQIELFFRCLKRCFKGLNLWAQDAKGIEVQFYIYMITYLLLIYFKQDTHDALAKVEESNASQPTSSNPLEISSTAEPVMSSENLEDKQKTNKDKSRIPACRIVTMLGEHLKQLWKIGTHWLIALRNNLFYPCTIDRLRLINSS